MGGQVTVHESFLPFRKPAVLKHMVEEVDLFTGVHFNDPKWREFYQTVKGYNHLDALAIKKGLKSGFAFIGFGIDTSDAIWINTLMKRREQQITVLHEFLHIYEDVLRELIYVEDRYIITSPLPWYVRRNQREEWQPLYKRRLSETLIEAEARTILEERPDVLDCLCASYPQIAHLRTDNV